MRRRGRPTSCACRTASAPSKRFKKVCGGSRTRWRSRTVVRHSAMTGGGTGPLILGAAEVASALTARDAVTIVERGIVDAHRGRVVAPARLLVDLPGAGRHYTVMPA